MQDLRGCVGLILGNWEATDIIDPGIRGNAVRHECPPSSRVILASHVRVVGIVNSHEQVLCVELVAGYLTLAIASLNYITSPVKTEFVERVVRVNPPHLPIAPIVFPSRGVDVAVGHRDLITR